MRVLIEEQKLVAVVKGSSQTGQEEGIDLAGGNGRALLPGVR